MGSAVSSLRAVGTRLKNIRHLVVIASLIKLIALVPYGVACLICRVLKRVSKREIFQAKMTEIQ